MNIHELMAAKDHLERGVAILRKAGNVQADDIQGEIDVLRDTITDLQLERKAA